MTDPRPLEIVVRELADRAAIADVIAAYARMADDNRADLQGELFTEDCITSYYAGLDLHGRAAVVEKLGSSLARLLATTHIVGNIEITFEDDDTARSTSSLIAWHREADGREWTLYGRYADRFTRTADGWKFTERRLLVAGATGRDTSKMLPLPRDTGARFAPNAAPSDLTVLVARADASEAGA